MTLDINIKAEDVRFLREEKQIGLYEARAILTKERLLSAVDSATTVEELKEIIRYMVKNG